MRSLLVLLLLAAAFVPTAQAGCSLDGGYYDCGVEAGPARAGATLDTRWWPIDGEVYHCVDVPEWPPINPHALCQSYRLA